MVIFHCFCHVFHRIGFWKLDFTELMFVYQEKKTSLNHCMLCFSKAHFHCTRTLEFLPNLLLQ